jgi:geranylgeranyl diphosphate synthase type I
MGEDLAKDLKEVSKHVDAFIDEVLRESPQEGLYKAARHLIFSGGKRLRPFILITSCKLVGGDESRAIPFAAAIELLHNFTLIHDDIMDQDRVRRGVPTVHTMYGVPVAIISGDLLFAKTYEAALKAMNNVPSRTLIKVLDIITNSTIAICEGQALDMAFEEREDVTEQEYFEMIERKTARLMVAAAQIGAIVGEGSPIEVDKIGQAVKAAGLAFQLVDDILGLTGDEKTLGKPVGSDIKEGKKTLIIIHGLKKADKQQRKAILRTLGNREASPEDINEVIDILKSLGSIDYAAAKAEGLHRVAKDRISFFPPSAARDRFLSLFEYILLRER